MDYASLDQSELSSSSNKKTSSPVMEDSIFCQKMCVAISMVKCIYSSGSSEDVRLTSKKLFEAIDCEQYPVKYHFTLDHLKYALSFKKLRSHLEASSVTFEDDRKPDSISIDDIRFPQLQRSYTLHFPAGYESLWERNELTTLSGSSEDIQ